MGASEEEEEAALNDWPPLDEDACDAANDARVPCPVLMPVADANSARIFAPATAEATSSSPAEIPELYV